MNHGKIFSIGMDVEYLRRVDNQKTLDYVMIFQKLLSKFLTFCLPTIAIISGHAVGAGCVFALAHDYRIMTSDHGYIFMNEVNLGMSLLQRLADILRATFLEVVLSGCALHLIFRVFFNPTDSIEYSGKDMNGKSALAAGIVHGTCAGGDNLIQLGIEKDGDLQEYQSGARK